MLSKNRFLWPCMSSKLEERLLTPQTSVIVNFGVSVLRIVQRFLCNHTIERYRTVHYLSLASELFDEEIKSNSDRQPEALLWFLCVCDVTGHALVSVSKRTSFVLRGQNLQLIVCVILHSLQLLGRLRDKNLHLIELPAQRTGEQAVRESLHTLQDLHQVDGTDLFLFSKG